MNLSGLLIAGALLLGQLSPTKPEMSEETLQVMAFCAQEVAGDVGKQDEQLKPYKGILEALAPLNKFDVIKTSTLPALHGEITTVSINALYWAEVQVSAPDEQGALPMVVRIMYDDGSGPIAAINAQGSAQPNRAFTFRGMELGGGELVVVLSFPKEGEQGEGSDSSGEENSQEQEQQEQGADQSQQEEQDSSASEQDESKDEEEAPMLNQQEETEAQEGDEEGASEEEMQDGSSSTLDEGEPKDDQTIEAILESLEEEDTKEQENAHHRRSQVKFKSKGWW